MAPEYARLIQMWPNSKSYSFNFCSSPARKTLPHRHGSSPAPLSTLYEELQAPRTPTNSSRSEGAPSSSCFLSSRANGRHAAPPPRPPWATDSNDWPVRWSFITSVWLGPVLPKGAPRALASRRNTLCMGPSSTRAVGHWPRDGCGQREEEGAQRGNLLPTKKQ